MNEENDEWKKDFYCIKEYWTDENGTLAQAIMYIANNEINKKWLWNN